MDCWGIREKTEKKRQDLKRRNWKLEEGLRASPLSSLSSTQTSAGLRRDRQVEGPAGRAYTPNPGVLLMPDPQDLLCRVET